MSRTSNSIKNIITGFMLQGVTAILSFMTRSAMISAIGIESVAINGLFTEIISALSLAELGVGSAIIFNLYKPLAEKNYKKVNQLMNLFRQAYTAIALATMVIGILICPWIQYLVNGLSFKVWYLRTVYLLFVIQCASSYLLAYKASLLNADQKLREQSIISTIIKIIGTILQIVLLYITKQYISYLIMSIMITLFTNFIISVRVDKMYPFLKHGEFLERGEKKKIFSNIRNIFFKQLAGKIVDSTDNILISTLINTLLVGYYANYLSIIGVLKQLAGQLTSGIFASMGNLFVSEGPEHCELILNRLEYFFRWIALILTVCTFGSIQIFISLWLGQQYLLPKSVIIWCCINMYCYIAINPLSTAMHLTGRFDIGRNISICSALVNLFASIILGTRFGMAGIFIGTFSTYFLEFFAKNYYLYKIFFKKSPFPTILEGSSSFFTLILMLLIVYYVLNHIVFRPSIISFIICGFICAFLCIFMVIITQYKTEAFNYWIRFCCNIFKKNKSKV